ncbi:MAG: adenosine deaminase [Bacteroidales bacterium]|nr:adenosine deaminase [Bacteroidales bacterium]
MAALSMEEFVTGIPKAELHLHIEGTFEPELMFRIAARNHMNLPYHSVEALRKAYHFSNLQDFLHLYYAGTSVLVEEQDFYDLTWAYLKKMQEQQVVHTEIFFDPQAHTGRGVQFRTVINGIHQALKDAEKELNISSKLIMSFLRHLDEASAMKTLDEALKYKDWIAAIGLDSSEKDNAPSKFQRVFEKALKENFLTVAHAGEEGPADYVRQAMDILKVFRIDHGNRSLEDEDLIGVLVERKIPLTICPLSNLKLKVVHDLKSHPLKTMMDKGLMVTVNSDDPAYFGGYLNENYLAVVKALNLNKMDVCQLAKNSFMASLMDDVGKQDFIEQVETFYRKSL